MHMTHDRSLLRDIRPSVTHITIGDGRRIASTYVGKIELHFVGNGRHTFDEVLLVPELDVNLFSPTALAKAGTGYEVVTKDGVTEMRRGGELIGRASVMGMGVPELHLAKGECARSARRGDAVKEAHEAAGHPGKAAMLGMLRQGTIGGVGVTVDAIHGFYQYPCDACAESKTVRASFPANKESRDLSDGPITSRTHGRGWALPNQITRWCSILRDAGGLNRLARRPYHRYKGWNNSGG
jgi:hypothetical protein